MARKSEAVKIMLQLVKAPLEKEFSFKTDKGMGKKRLHRVRVELSRVREIAFKNKIVVRHFKILERSIEPDPDDPAKEIVTVFKTAGKSGAIQEDILDALLEMGAVKQLGA